LLKFAAQALIRAHRGRPKKVVTIGTGSLKEAAISQRVEAAVLARFFSEDTDNNQTGPVL
jgi:hypothetical protein